MVKIKPHVAAQKSTFVFCINYACIRYFCHLFGKYVFLINWVISNFTFSKTIMCKCNNSYFTNLNGSFTSIVSNDSWRFFCEHFFMQIGFCLKRRHYKRASLFRTERTCSFWYLLTELTIYKLHFISFSLRNKLPMNGSSKINLKWVNFCLGTSLQGHFFPSYYIS